MFTQQRQLLLPFINRSVFAGSFGHSYGHNDIMQFIRPGVLGSFGADGMKKAWWDALEDPGFYGDQRGAVDA